MGAIQPWHLILVLVVVLLVFGPKRLPEVGKSLGETIRELRKATTGETKDSISQAAAPAATPPAAPVQPPPSSPVPIPPAASATASVPADPTPAGSPGPSTGSPE